MWIIFNVNLKKEEAKHLFLFLFLKNYFWLRYSFVFVEQTSGVLGKYTTSQYYFKNSNLPFQSSPITKKSA